jgi:hypothetical protein|tara:strand:+ start:3534 stop:3722 length:189 start_codon:yes stop_codon:yes gene_type:complete
MDRDLARELEISLRLLKKVVNASENPDNVQEHLANYTAFIQVEMVVKNYIELSDLAERNRAR